MPKQKTSRAAAKRFRATGGGVLVRLQAGRKHYKVGRKARSRRLARLQGEVTVSRADRSRVSRLLGR